MKKIYILDTNILMQTYGEAILGFADNTVVITGTTLEELDRLKSCSGEKGYSARCAIKEINKVYNKKTLLENRSSVLSNGGLLKIETKDVSKIKLPIGWDINKADNNIIATALDIQINNKLNKNPMSVILITNDVSMQIKAQSVGLCTQDYHNTLVNKDDLCQGKITIDVPSNIIDDFYKKKKIDLLSLPIPSCMKNISNLFLLMRNNANLKQTALAFKKGNEIFPIIHKEENFVGISPRNVTQHFAIEALEAPAEEIPLVILRGPAGCGKTLLATAVGLDKTLDGEYRKIIISRSNSIPEGEDLGTLPGSLDAKMSPLLSPFYDNIEVMIENKYGDEDPAQIKMQIEDYFDAGTIEITSLAYIRGRSIPNSYIIIDEAQNLTQNQVKTIITRAGTGTKIVLAGDPDQIDSSKLTKYSNGLVYASKIMQDSPLCVQLEFDSNECERSPLAFEAAEKMKDQF